MSYAAMKGRAAPAAKAAAPAPARPLTKAEEARVEDNKAFVLERLPDLQPFMRDLYAENLIDGWRAVENCKLKERK